MHETTIACTSPIDHQPPSLTERLESEKARLEDRLEEVTSLLESIKSHSELEHVLNSIYRLGMHY